MLKKSELVVTPKCASCGSLKGSTNHWWTIEDAFAEESFQGRILIGPYDPNNVMAGCWHVCGLGCLNAVISEYTSEVLKMKTDHSNKDHSDPLPGFMKSIGGVVR